MGMPFMCGRLKTNIKQLFWNKSTDNWLVVLLPDTNEKLFSIIDLYICNTYFTNKYSLSFFRKYRTQIGKTNFLPLCFSQAECNIWILIKLKILELSVEFLRTVWYKFIVWKQDHLLRKEPYFQNLLSQTTLILQDAERNSKCVNSSKTGFQTFGVIFANLEVISKLIE